MYKITYEMAEFLIRHLYEQTYGIKKIKDSSPEKIQKIFDLHIELNMLLVQLEKDGHDVTLLKQEIQEQIQKKYRYKELVIEVDGGVRDINDKSKKSLGACAFKIYGDGQPLFENSYYLGDEVLLPKHSSEKESPKIEITTNIAEYIAILKAMEYLITFNPNAESIIIKSDSEVAISQINMIFTTRVDNLLRLRNEVHRKNRLLNGLVEFVKIPREENTEVDLLVNRCLDKIQMK